MKTFLEEMKESFPKSIPMPPEIEAMFLWLEQNGFVHKYTHTDERFANLYQEHLIDHGGAFAQFIFAEIDSNKYYTGSDDPFINNRLALFVRVDKCGDRAGIWLDDDGNLNYVFVPSHGEPGCFLTDNTIDFIRLLAIGYENLALDNYDLTAKEEYKNYLGNDNDEPLPLEPIEFREWVDQTFSVKVPKYGNEIVKIQPSKVEENSPDPFLLWCQKVRN
ncbi:hypothetical protein [Pigmentibacter ruber]|uniref:hypothetical protein n=1 Tax=Pigmentibacter ruber TaxID=2683196 RepID=UPI00131B07CE|nr:hypothetical protein [Pigmentibacter ruber]